MTRQYYCLLDDMDCPYYMPSITGEKNCGLDDAPEQCDGFEKYYCDYCDAEIPNGFEDCSECCGNCGECDECADKWWE